jgi:hypothetical protein
MNIPNRLSCQFFIAAGSAFGQVACAGGGAAWTELAVGSVAVQNKVTAKLSCLTILKVMNFDFI